MRTCRHESGGMCGALLDPLCISMAVSSRIHCTRWNHPRLVCSTLWCVSSDSGRLAYILASGPMLHMNVSALIRVCEYATIYTTNFPANNTSNCHHLPGMASASRVAAQRLERAQLRADAARKMPSSTSSPSYGGYWDGSDASAFHRRRSRDQPMSTSQRRACPTD